MQSIFSKKAMRLGLTLLLLWLSVRYLLPALLPFLMGALLALLAEPAVSFFTRRLHLPRGWASGLGVTVSIGLLAGLLTLVGAGAVGQLARLQLRLPDLADQAQNLKDWLIGTADNAPEGIRSLAQNVVLEVFDDSALLMEQVAERIPGLLGRILGGVGSSVLGVGTGLLAAFLISARLPKLRQGLRERLPKSWYETYLPALKRIRHSLGQWLKAQGLLAAVTWGILSLGFLLLRIPRWLLLGGLIALVDAVPILGTGTVMLPWALITLLQGNSLRGIGLLAIYGAAAITRTCLEPRLIGRQLGLDPLLTLLAMYLGYQLWGIPGLLFTPILASAALNVAREG